MIANSLSCSFNIRNYETDFMRKIKPSAILGFFQESAGAHSDEMGLGTNSLREHGYFWVLSKIYIEIDKRPKVGDSIEVVTWPHAPNKAIYERSFAVNVAGGEGCIRAFSRWCILQASNGRVLPCSRVEQKIQTYIDKKAVDFDNWMIEDIEEKGAPSFEIKIANSEYDLNYHVNNIKYADYIFNCFTVAELQEREIKSFQIHYVKQSHEGDRLRFYKAEDFKNNFRIVGVKNDEEIVVMARVCFA